MSNAGRRSGYRPSNTPTPSSGPSRESPFLVPRTPGCNRCGRAFPDSAGSGGIWAWSYYSARESTDDARIDGHVAPVSARVGGTVIEIFVDENDMVNAGQMVARIDDRDYRIALQRAEADLTAQQATATAARTQMPIASSSTASGLSGAQAAEPKRKRVWRRRTTSAERTGPYSGSGSEPAVGGCK